jgi:hypothetical protein
VDEGRVPKTPKRYRAFSALGAFMIFGGGGKNYLKKCLYIFITLEFSISQSY